MPELVCSADDRDAWLAARRSGVTATDIVAILGLSSRQSVYSLFWQKMGQVPEPPDNDRWRLGRELEPYVIRRWQESTGFVFSDDPGNCLYRSPARPWQLATLDARTEPSGGTGEPVEVKTWADADRDSWGASGGSEVPPAVRAQVLWQMDVMDASAGYAGVLFLPSGEFRDYTISLADHRPDDDGNCPECLAREDIELMRAAGEEFMARLRMELPPPDPDSSAATLAAAKARFAKAKGKRGQVDGVTWTQWLAFKSAADELQAETRAYEIQIREQLGEADEIEVGGQLVGRRIVTVQHVKEHDRRMDYLKRIKSNGSSDVQ